MGRSNDTELLTLSVLEWGTCHCRKQWPDTCCWGTRCSPHPQTPEHPMVNKTTTLEMKSHNIHWQHQHSYHFTTIIKIIFFCIPLPTEVAHPFFSRQTAWRSRRIFAWDDFYNFSWEAKNCFFKNRDYFNINYLYKIYSKAYYAQFF